MRTILTAILSILAALCVVLLMAGATEVFGQNNGAMPPWFWPTFPNANGSGPAANGFVCTTATGSMSPLATYQNQTLTTPNQNPIRLNAAGRAVNGGNEVRIFLQPRSYRFTVYAAGSSNDCDGTPVGTELRQVDNVYDLAALFLEEFNPYFLDKVCHASEAAGANAGAKIATCIAALPSTGGTVDARGLEGAQSIISNIFSGVTKAVVLQLGGSTYTLSASMTVPSNVTLEFGQGSIWSVNTGLTLTIRGPVDAQPVQIFSGAGTVTFGSAGTNYDARVDGVYPQWWGAKGDGTRTQGTVSASSTSLTVTASTCSSADVGKAITVEGAGTNAATLVTTIASCSGTGITLSVAASSSSTAGQVIWASDDTSAIQKAVDAFDTVFFPPGVYGATRFRINQANQLLGSGKVTTVISRIGEGSGGDFIAMAGSDLAQKVQLSEMSIQCNQIGSALDCVDLTDFAFNAWINNVNIYSASGTCLNLPNVNVGVIGQVWCINREGSGTPLALAVTSAKGIVVTGHNLVATLLSVEGRYGANPVVLGGGNHKINEIQLQVYGTFPSVDAVTITGLSNLIGYVYFGSGGTLRDIVHIDAAAQDQHIGFILNDTSFGGTLTNLLRDVDSGVTLAADAQNVTVTDYNTDRAGNACYTTDYATYCGKRFGMMQGTSAVAANDLTLGYDGNVFHITGNTQINGIKLERWPDGSSIKLFFSGTPTIKHNTAPSAGFGKLMNLGNVDIVVPATDYTVLDYTLIGTEWWQTSPSGFPVAQVYTPTAANLSNMDSVTPSEAIYDLNADMVNVGGVVIVNATTAGTAGTFTLTLPSGAPRQGAANFSQVYQAFGNATAVGVTGEATIGMAIQANTSSVLVKFSYVPLITTDQQFTYQFSYRRN